MLFNKRNLIYYCKGYSVLFLNSLCSEMHSHYPAEIYTGLNNNFKINFGYGWIKCRAVLIDSNIPHRVDGNGGLTALLLISPILFKIYKLQKSRFNNLGYYILNNNAALSIIEKMNRFGKSICTFEDVKNLTDEIFALLFNLDSMDKNIDLRIKTALNILEDIPEKRMSSQELARSIHLSESRLAHLFKDNTGVPIRKYLLWAKLRQASKLMLEGESFTTAAHESGFSDSAHLSRTYRQTFGISPSSVLKSYKSTMIIF